jgi:hypothetical protein
MTENRSNKAYSPKKTENMGQLGITSKKETILVQFYNNLSLGLKDLLLGEK